MDHLIAIIPLLAGWILDRFFGDPENIPHPVVGFGKVIAWCEHRFNKGTDKVRNGAFTAIGLILSVFFLTVFLLRAVSPYPLLRPVLETVLVFFCLAGTTLMNEVRMVFEATDRSLDEGRRQVSRIVGRDTSELSAQEVRLAALETLAENLSDGVVAPLFWWLLLGVPGMLAYKMVNTLDSMIGYKNERYRDFGRWAAKIDDVANFIPARLTAFLILLAAGRLDLWKFVKRFGKQHASPNSGYPEAALAAVLDCRFGGTHNYFGEAVYKPYIGVNDRPVTTLDMQESISVCRRAEIFALLLVACIRFPFR